MKDVPYQMFFMHSSGLYFITSSRVGFKPVHFDERTIKLVTTMRDKRSFICFRDTDITRCELPNIQANGFHM